METRGQQHGKAKGLPIHPGSLPAVKRRPLHRVAVRLDEHLDGVRQALRELQEAGVPVDPQAAARLQLALSWDGERRCLAVN